MIEEKEGNRRCEQCDRRTIAPWHSRAAFCDDCLHSDAFVTCVNRNEIRTDRHAIGTDDADRWIADNWKDDNEKALEDSRC